jgi:hypothetical protein
LESIGFKNLIQTANYSAVPECCTAVDVLASSTAVPGFTYVCSQQNEPVLTAINILTSLTLTSAFIYA